jgi:predicted acyltransferase
MSLDAYRGFIMLAMVSALGVGLAQVAGKFPEPHLRSLFGREFDEASVWSFLADQFEHVTWGGCVFWDLIQPAFMFMVGVAMPFSHASRLDKGDSRWKIVRHVVIRSVVLILLGIFLSSNWGKRTDFTFVNVLTQIGLGYAFVYVLIGRGWLVQLLAAVAILGGYWYYFYQYPAPPPDFDYVAVNFPPSKFQHFTGLFAHWNPSNNAAAEFDRWFLNLFPRTQEFKFNHGGYQTLNFVPSMATMIFGLMAGELLRSDRSSLVKLLILIVAAGALGAAGWWLDKNYCPSVKRIWTPSWTLYSTGWTLAMLAGFYAVIDIIGFRIWSWPLVVVGMNSIAVYCISQLLRPWVRDTINRHLPPDYYGGSDYLHGKFFGRDLISPTYQPLIEPIAFLLVVWLISVWMYRQRLFVKI